MNGGKGEKQMMFCLALPQVKDVDRLYRLSRSSWPDKERILGFGRFAGLTFAAQRRRLSQCFFRAKEPAAVVEVVVAPRYGSVR